MASYNQTVLLAPLSLASGFTIGKTLDTLFSGHAEKDRDIFQSMTTIGLQTSMTAVILLYTARQNLMDQSTGLTFFTFGLLEAQPGLQKAVHGVADVLLREIEGLKLRIP